MLLCVLLQVATRNAAPQSAVQRRVHTSGEVIGVVSCGEYG
jgi:hypothetical protein